MGVLLLGEMIREVRNKQGLTQAELANRLSVSRPTVSFWETERQTPNEEQVELLEHVLDTALNAAGSQRNFTWKDAILHVLNSSGEAAELPLSRSQATSSAS